MINKIINFRLLSKKNGTNSDPAISESGTVAIDDGINQKQIPTISLYNNGKNICDTNDENNSKQYIYDTSLETNETQKKI